MRSGILGECHEIHADQDEGHECKKDAVVLLDLEGGFFFGFHDNGIVSQLSFNAIVRADSVRKDSVRFPEGAIVMGDDNPYTGHINNYPVGQ
jgi:hypothetical protein